MKLETSNDFKEFKPLDNSSTLKIKNLAFFGFSIDELLKIRDYIEKNSLEEITPGFVQDCCDLIGKDIGLMITPQCVGMICMGE